MKKRLLFVFGIIACWMSGGNAHAQSPDAGVVSIESLSAICEGNYQVKAVVQNYGHVQIDTVIVNWSVDGVVQPSVEHTSLLDTAGSLAGSSTVLLALGNYNFIREENYEVKVWTSMPNHEEDTMTINDTAVEMLILKDGPSGLMVTNITSSTADVLFDSLPATDYVIIYDTLGFDPLSQGSNVSGITSPYNITGLISNRAYDIYIYADCGNGVSSDTVGPVSFKTTCLSQSLPFTENFDSGEGCFQVINGGSSNESWAFFPALPPVPFPSSDGTPYAFCGNFEGGAGIRYEETLLSPVIDAGNFPSGHYLILEFDHEYISYDIGPDSINVDIYNGISWQNIYRVADSTTVDFTTVDLNNFNVLENSLIFDITDYAAADMQVRFTYGKDPDEGGMWLVDNISIKSVPCLQPLKVELTNIYADSVTVLNEVGSGFDYEIDTTGFSRGMGRISGVTSNPGTISGLTGDAYYDLYVRNNCDTNGNSDWVGPYTFKTRCSLSDRLAGNYTIDPSQSTGGTNFASFTEVCRHLRNCGISGPVVFNVSAGTYNDSIVLSHIDGTNPANTITFRGAGASPSILTSSSNLPTVYLDGANHVILKNLTISNTRNATDTWGILLRNKADHITIDSCRIEMPVTTVTDIAGIVATGNLASDVGRGDNANYLTVSNCTITGGESGIALTGGDGFAFGNPNTGHIIKNNVFRSQDDHAISIRYVEHIRISRNDIDSLKRATASAINGEYISDYEVSANKVNLPLGGYGLRLSYGNANTSSRSQIVNNMISSGGSRDGGINLSNIQKTDILHNSVTGVTAIKAENYVDKDIRNNIFYSTGSYAFVLDATDTSDVIDYNVYYGSSPDLFQTGGVNYLDLAMWKIAYPSLNNNSIQGDPLFVNLSGGDLHASGVFADNNADSSVSVAEDIDGDLRSATTPDIGADEYTVICPDVADFSIINQDFSSGTSTFTFNFDREGDNYNIEIGPCGFEQGTGTINVTGSSPVTVSGLTPNNCYDLYVRRDCDPDKSEWRGPFTFITQCPDSLKLSGTYTIDPAQAVSETNFTSFNDATAALSCGIAGHVVFNVSPGVYNENVILSKISGTSLDSTITFRGLDRENTILHYISPDGTPAIHFQGANYVRFKEMTIKISAHSALNPSTFLSAIVLQNAADYNIIDSCSIEMPRNTAYWHYGVRLTSTPQTLPEEGNNANYFTISNSLITGGEVGISLRGGNDQDVNTGHIIENNVFRHQSSVGINANSIRNILVKGNEVDSVGQGIFFREVNDYEVSGNKIKTLNGNGIDLHYCNNVPVDSFSLVFNNMALSNRGEGIYLNRTHNTKIYYNSIIGSPALNVRGQLNIDIRNNIFYAKDISAAIMTHAIILQDTLGSGDTVDHNLYYSSHSALLQIGGVDYIDLSDWQVIQSQYDVHSLEDHPLFVDPSSDLHIIYSRGHSKADTSVGVAVDIDGDARAAQPSIGADEFIIPPCEPSYNLEALAVYTDSARLHWNAGTGSTFNLWYGPKGFMNDPAQMGTKLTGINNSPYTLTGLTPQTVYEVYISDNCGDSAGSSAIDTSVWYSPVTVKTLCSRQLSGVYTIDSSQSTGGRNFNNFDDAIFNLVDCGITGPVIFDILPGTYNSIVLEEVPGISAVNTVTFQGLGTETEITSALQQVPAVYFDGADHIILKNIMITHTSTASVSWGVLLRNGADSNTIDSCVIQMPSGVGTGIATSSSLSFNNGYGNNANYLTISNCRVTGGAYGVYVAGDDDDNQVNKGHLINGNKIVRSGAAGIYTQYVQDVQIINNTIDSAFTSGISVNYTGNYKILRNYVHTENSYGLWGNYNNSINNHSQVVNNMISSENSKGMYLRGTKNINVFNNSISGHPAVEIENFFNGNVRNNIFFSTSGSAFVSSDTLNSEGIVDYNLYYTTDTASALIEVSGEPYSTLLDWQTDDALRNINSIEANPLFISPLDMHIRSTSPAIDAGDTSLNVYEDIDGHQRPAPGSAGVDIGADEFFVECPLSENITIDTIQCNSATLVWDPGVPVVYSIIEYDTAGFVMGEGKRIFKSSPAVINGLQPGEDYEVYLLDTCGIDTVTIAGPIPFTTPSGPLQADFNLTINSPTATNQTVDFDATSSQGAQGYVWNFGDGSPSASGVTTSHAYTKDSIYIVTLTITGPCGTDIITDTVEIRGISIKESILSRTLKVYPNPTQDRVQLSFETGSSEGVLINLTDFSGKVIMRRNYTDVNGSFNKSLDLGGLAKGSYMLRIESGELRVVERIVKN